ncbi:MAG: polysaccharide biosynthesis/export family protein [Planctomycetota bacterium]
MSQGQTQKNGIARWGLTLTAIAGLGTGVGCEVDSYIDPSIVGNWEETPVTVNILSRIGAIEGDVDDLPTSPPTRQDLLPDEVEYAIGAGDEVQITIFEFQFQNQDSAFVRRVDATGRIRLPSLNAIEVAGKTPSLLERDIARALAAQEILDNAIVTVTLLAARQNTFSIIGDPTSSGTTSAFGTYVIPKPDFRLLDAIALARGIDGRVKNLRIFRQVILEEEDQADLSSPEQTDPVASDDPEGDFGAAIAGGADSGEDVRVEDRPAPPSGIEVGGDSPTPFVVVGDEFQAVPALADGSGSLVTSDGTPVTADELGQLITQRIIEVPYQRLRTGDLRYNIVIRPGDIINVPDQNAGFVYVMGAINRPGAYTVPGDNDLTLKQLVASAGGLSGLAIPHRVDLIRRIGDDREATIRLDLDAIFKANGPDIFLKPNDLVNVGTNLPATPLAVIRNGFRATYGFGFLLDRNFADDVFGDQTN